jgi:hypothetical protein
MRSTILGLLAALSLGGPSASAQDHQSCHTKSCTLRVEMKFYKKHPMPWCTWGPESPGHPEWSPARYRVWNTSGSSPERASGKFQIIGPTWRAYGGQRISGRRHAAEAAPVYQERIARSIARARPSLSDWVNC